jgi:hypothetical protein
MPRTPAIRVAIDRHELRFKAEASYIHGRPLKDRLISGFASGCVVWIAVSFVLLMAKRRGDLQ